MTLEILDKDYYDDVVRFATESGQIDSLQAQLDYLSTYSDERCKCVLYKDFAPYSFAFTMQMKNEAGEYVRRFNGGLIYHGSHDNGGVGGGAPTFSCTASPVQGWKVHT